MLKTKTVCFLSCDQCGFEGAILYSAITPLNVFQEAYQLGGWRLQDDRDLCPKCANIIRPEDIKVKPRFKEGDQVIAYGNPKNQGVIVKELTAFSETAYLIDFPKGALDALDPQQIPVYERHLDLVGKGVPILLKPEDRVSLVNGGYGRVITYAGYNMQHLPVYKVEVNGIEQHIISNQLTKVDLTSETEK